MDLTTIKKNIDIGAIRTTAEFQRDMMLIFTNAIMYNDESHDVHRRARDMYRDVMAQIEVIIIIIYERDVMTHIEVGALIFLFYAITHLWYKALLCIPVLREMFSLIS